MAIGKMRTGTIQSSNNTLKITRSDNFVCRVWWISSLSRKNDTRCYNFKQYWIPEFEENIFSFSGIISIYKERRVFTESCIAIFTQAYKNNCL